MVPLREGMDHVKWPNVAECRAKPCDPTCSITNAAIALDCFPHFPFTHIYTTRNNMLVSALILMAAE
jgi:hypothetical protein